MELPCQGELNINPEEAKGTLAIDLGNSTTVVAFQGQKDREPILIEIYPITRVPGQVPSLIWYSENASPDILVGQEVLNLKITENTVKNINSDFKRWIGSSENYDFTNFNIEPEKAGEILIQKIWECLPTNLNIERLVLTAPVETYRAYRHWLNKVCSALPVKEVALIDEPTAAAMGAGLPPGAKLLVIDIGGSTIDLSMVALEGGEGKPEPIAQLIKFNGQDLEGKSKQVLRCAKVISKTGIRLGGRDFDRWIANHICSNIPLTLDILNAAEKLKCRLSQSGLKINEVLTEEVNPISSSDSFQLSLNRIELEEILIKKGLLLTLKSLLNKTLVEGAKENCKLEDLNGVVIVGGGAHIPLIRNWLTEEIKPAKLITPPPVEAVAKGALSLTPGVKILDVLHKGVCLRCWDQRKQKHTWHPIFIAGQPWPTSNPFEIVLAASVSNQTELEFILGEPEIEGSQEVIYVDGIPTIKARTGGAPSVNEWIEPAISIYLNPPGQPGEDCVRLKFIIDHECNLIVEGIDIRSNIIIRKEILGSIR